MVITIFIHYWHVKTHMQKICSGSKPCSELLAFEICLENTIKYEVRINVFFGELVMYEGCICDISAL